MSKALDKLEHLRKGVQYINQDESPAFISQYEEDCDIIEKALKRLNYIDENKTYCVSENYLQDIKKIKAFEIIKEKKWLVEDILNAFIEDKEKYNLLKEIFK